MFEFDLGKSYHNFTFLSDIVFLHSKRFRYGEKGYYYVLILIQKKNVVIEPISGSKQCIENGKFSFEF